VTLDDVVKELRSAATFGLLLSAIWLASSGGYVEALRHRAEMKHLMAYVFLKDEVSDRLRDDFEGVLVSNACPSPQDANCKATELKFNPPWDPSKDLSIRLTIVPIRANTTFEVQHNHSRDHLPFEYYCFDIREKVSFYPPTGQPTHNFGGPPSSSFCNFGNQVDEPYLWEQMRGWLYSSGVTALKPKDIHLTDPVISKLAIQYLSPDGDIHQDVAGLPVPIYFAPFVIGALLTVSSSVLIGTAVAFFGFRRRADCESTSWVMLYTGYGRGLTLIASIALAFGALAVPIAAIARTWQILHTTKDAEVSALPIYALMVGLVLLLGTLILNLIAQVRLRASLIRRSQRSVEKQQEGRA
jgi:hypothetical protein